MSAELQALVKLQSNLCLSGGAKGSDVQWGMNAGRAGHSVIHWSFDGHKCLAPEVETVRLTETQLAAADPFIDRANKTLTRNMPSSEYTINLFRRNYYQIAWAESVYAVAAFKKGRVDGGTGWAVQMYMDRFLHDLEPLDTCKLYVYDQALGVWMQWQGSWVTLAGAPPQPSGVWAGIGTRDLLDNGKWAIRELWGWLKPQAPET